MSKNNLIDDSSPKCLNPIKNPYMISKSVPKNKDKNKFISNINNILNTHHLETINNHYKLNMKNIILPKIPRRLMFHHKPILDNILIFKNKDK